MTEGFLTDVNTMILFFRICRRYHLDDLDDRTVLMRELTRRKKAKYLRDVEEYTKGKRVHFIKRKSK